METQNPTFLEQEKEKFLQLARFGNGSPLKAFLALKEISQCDLAKKVGVTPSEISLVVSGRRKTPHIRRAIAVELKIPVGILFGETESQKSDADAITKVAPYRTPAL